MRNVIRAVLCGAAAATVAGCASTSDGSRSTHARATAGRWDTGVPAGKEHYQFAPLPPAETTAQDLEPSAPRSTSEILAEAELQFVAAKEAQDLGDDTRTYEHFAAMMDRLLEAKLDPENFARVRDGYTTQLRDGLTMQRIYDGTQPDAQRGPVLDDQVDGTATINDRVRAEIEAIQRVYSKSFQAGLDRSYKYLPYIQARFAEAGLPDDLVWLAMVESQFTPKINSRAGAGGMWQFMKGTGRRYGLRSDWYLDERYDWRKATNAAVQYLSELYEMFDGNWPLAVTAYNMGEGGLGRAIRTSGGEADLWRLLDTKSASSRIKLESKRFYAKLLATAIVAKNPEQYGFERRPQPAEDAEPLTVKGFYSIAEIEKESGLKRGALAAMNPQFIRGYTPPAREAILAIPAAHNQRIKTALATMPELRPGTHLVLRGETLSQIAALYKVSVSELQSTNAIKSPKSLRAGQRLVIPGGIAAADDEGAVMATATGAKTYTVRRGDSLSRIAANHRVSVKDLQRWNGMGTRTEIRAGQKLLISPPAAPASEVRMAAAISAADTTEGDVKYHTVKKGEYPEKIARAYGVSLDDFLQWNGLTKRSTIQIGQKLKIVTANKEASAVTRDVAKATPGAPSDSARTHTVRRGETATSIARKYGVSTKDILNWNGLTAKSVLQIGDTLIVQKPEASGAAAPTQKPVRVAKSAEVGTVRHIHSVAMGENAATIARQYDVTEEVLFQWNGWTAAPALSEGDEVVVFQPALTQD